MENERLFGNLICPISLETPSEDSTYGEFVVCWNNLFQRTALLQYLKGYRPKNLIDNTTLIKFEETPSPTVDPSDMVQATSFSYLSALLVLTTTLAKMHACGKNNSCNSEKSLETVQHANAWLLTFTALQWVLMYIVSYKTAKKRETPKEWVERNTTPYDPKLHKIEYQKQSEDKEHEKNAQPYESKKTV